jgi:hypothetical protein
MRLYVEELRATALVQVFERTDTCLLDRVRLHIYKHLSPAGTFTVSVTDSADNVIVSKSQSLADMQADGSADLQANYYHGHVSFIFDTKATLRPGTYKVKLSASGYTFSESAFIGWCKAWDDRAIPITGDTEPDAAVDSPYDFEMYALQRIR